MQTLTEKIQEQWPFYNNLHNIWSELPNYNPVGVTNSGPGQDFAARAATVFSKRSGKTDSSGVEDNYMIPDDKDDLAPMMQMPATMMAQSLTVIMNGGARSLSLARKNEVLKEKRVENPNLR